MYEPLYRHRPSHRWTYGDLACKVGVDLGLPPDDEQQWILDSMYAEKAPDRPASFEVVVISGRQQIKTSTFGIGALSDLFVFGVDKHLWTAHHGKTLQDTFGDFRRWLKSNHEYEDQVQFYEGHQDMSIVHKETGASIEFQSRSGRAGRGVTGVKRITVDEALYVEPKHIGALYPTTITMPDAQIRVASSAGLLTSGELRRIRDRGRGGKDNRLAYVEYGAKFKACLRADCSHVAGEVEGCALDDRDLWWQACCALWSGRIVEDAIENLRGSMPPEEFFREMYSRWDDPVSVGGALSVEAWAKLLDPRAERGESVVFGLDLAGERDVWLSVAWTREDGHTQVMLANDGLPVPAFRAVAECVRLHEEWGGPVATSAFTEELEKAEVPLVPVSAGDFAAACGLLADGVDQGTIRHGNQPALNGAVKAAEWRPALSDGERAFLLKDHPEVGPLAAAARALHGLANYDTDAWGFFD